ncbi:MAG: hypothetical protein VW378_00270 [bacterium]
MVNESSMVSRLGLSLSDTWKMAHGFTAAVALSGKQFIDLRCDNFVNGEPHNDCVYFDSKFLFYPFFALSSLSIMYAVSSSFKLDKGEKLEDDVFLSSVVENNKVKDFSANVFCKSSFLFLYFNSYVKGATPGTVVSVLRVFSRVCLFLCFVSTLGVACSRIQGSRFKSNIKEKVVNVSDFMKMELDLTVKQELDASLRMWGSVYMAFASIIPDRSKRFVSIENNGVILAAMLLFNSYLAIFQFSCAFKGYKLTSELSEANGLGCHLFLRELNHKYSKSISELGKPDMKKLAFIFILALFPNSIQSLINEDQLFQFACFCIYYQLLGCSYSFVFKHLGFRYIASQSEKQFNDYVCKTDDFYEEYLKELDTLHVYFCDNENISARQGDLPEIATDHVCSETIHNDSQLLLTDQRADLGDRFSGDNVSGDNHSTSKSGGDLSVARKKPGKKHGDKRSKGAFRPASVHRREGVVSTLEGRSCAGQVELLEAFKGLLSPEFITNNLLVGPLYYGDNPVPHFVSVDKDLWCKYYIIDHFNAISFAKKWGDAGLKYQKEYKVFVYKNYERDYKQLRVIGLKLRGSENLQVLPNGQRYMHFPLEHLETDICKRLKK